ACGFAARRTAGDGNRAGVTRYAEIRVSEVYGISGRDCSDHSGLMLAARITLPHFSVSAAMSVAKSAVEPESTEPLRSVNRALILGSASAALISLLSLSMISAGVFLGAPTPIHALAS